MLCHWAVLIIVFLHYKIAVPSLIWEANNFNQIIFIYIIKHLYQVKITYIENFAQIK